MQEDIEHRSITMVINGGKFTGRMLKSAIAKLYAHMKSKRHQHEDVIPHGKQSVKELIGQNTGVSNIEINDKGIKEFQRIARKYGVDFAIKKVKGDKPKHLVFFKARDADALKSAFEEYTSKRLKRENRPSVRKLLSHLKAISSKRDKVKHKDKEVSR
jgi:hypothetical protein